MTDTNELSPDDKKFLSHISTCKEAGESKKQFRRDVHCSIKKLSRKGYTKEYITARLKEASDKINQLWKLG